MDINGKTVGLYTLGCKVSQYETEAVAEEFERLGFKVLDFSEKCDVYVINTCTVTAEGDRKCRQVIRRAARKNPEAVIIALGCYGQRSPDEVAAIDGVGCVMGSGDKMSAPAAAIRMLEGKDPFPEGKIHITDIDNEPFEKMRISKGPRTRVYVKIEDGCESKCAYCAIPSARGRVRSKSREDVISEVEALRDSGVREVVLTGIETASYGKDFGNGYALADLLSELDKRGSAERIRLGSLAPELIGESFAEKVAGVSNLAPHFHISIQSGADSVLRGMKRRYTAKTALQNIERLRRLIPDAQFTTDIMVGFPGESEEDFLGTVEFVRQARFLDVHVFAYSKRHSTPAASYPDQVAEQIKRERSARLMQVVEEVRDSVLDEVISAGKALPCIFESKKCASWVAHSHNFISICIKCDRDDLCGEMLMVKPIRHEDGVVYGEIV